MATNVRQGWECLTAENTLAYYLHRKNVLWNRVHIHKVFKNNVLLIFFRKLIFINHSFEDSLNFLKNNLTNLYSNYFNNFPNNIVNSNPGAVFITNHILQYI